MVEIQLLIMEMLLLCYPTLEVFHIDCLKTWLCWISQQYKYRTDWPLAAVFLLVFQSGNSPITSPHSVYVIVCHIHESASPISKFDCSQLITIVIVDLNLWSMIKCCSLERQTNHILIFDLTACYHIDIIDSDVFRDKCISRAGTCARGH